MANYNQLKTNISSVIKSNNNQDITGQVLQDALKSMITELGKYYQYAGLASPSGNPGSPDQNVFYVALPGSYPNFGGKTVPKGGIGILRYNGTWSLDVVDTMGVSEDINCYNATAISGAKTLSGAIADVVGYLEENGLSYRRGMMVTFNTGGSTGDFTSEWQTWQYVFNGVSEPAGTVYGTDFWKRVDSGAVALPNTNTFDFGKVDSLSDESTEEEITAALTPAGKDAVCRPVAGDLLAKDAPPVLKTEVLLGADVKSTTGGTFFFSYMNEKELVTVYVNLVKNTVALDRLDLSDIASWMLETTDSQNGTVTNRDKLSNIPGAIIGSGQNSLITAAADASKVTLSYHLAKLATGEKATAAVALPAATQTAAGVMRAEDKELLDNLGLENAEAAIFIEDDLLGGLDMNSFDETALSKTTNPNVLLLLKDPENAETIRFVRAMPIIHYGTGANLDIVTIPFDDVLRNRIVMFDIDLTKLTSPNETAAVVGLRSIPKGNCLCMRIPQTVDGWAPDYGKLYLQYFQKTFGVDFYQYLHAAKNGLPVSFAFKQSMTLDSSGMLEATQGEMYLKISNGGVVYFDGDISLQTAIGTTPIPILNRTFTFPEADPNIPYTACRIIHNAPVNSNIKECTVEVSWD